MLFSTRTPASLQLQYNPTTRHYVIPLNHHNAYLVLYSICLDVLDWMIEQHSRILFLEQRHLSNVFYS